jgi:plasmid stabilization system protein ParE
MRKYRVVLQKLALSDLEEAYRNAAQHAPPDAAAWLDRIHIALQSLSSNPDRCPIAHENPRSTRELREFLVGRRPNVFRVVFTIEGDDVRRLRFRRAARRFLSRREIDESFRDEE